ncbi:MAG: 5'-methylthioadenosine/S-adenosylhomocysteine nucleosidase [Candidatus Zixiibacteriota bacterium]|nr:MAG: 5'-methylthioadenosine/S-adenosylhomocysteine nucleosidase [candidate division Zixibacteria bacterium]
MTRLLSCFVFAVLLLSCTAQVDPTAEGPVLILYAFNEEGQKISDRMDIRTVEHRLGREVKTGQLAGLDIVLAESGVGMTNAAMSAQHLIDSYRPVMIVMTGIAGGLDSTVRIGDVAVCRSWVQHDYVYVGNDSTRHRGIHVYHPPRDSIIRTSSFPIDSSLFAAAGTIKADRLDLKDIDGREPVLHVGGVGISGNGFIDSREKRSQLVAQFDALIVDMESAAVVHVGLVNDLPVIVIRSASDLAGGSDEGSARDQLDQFFQVAADNSAEILEAFLRTL